MSVRRDRVEMVPDFIWFIDHKFPKLYRDMADDPSKDPDCLTVNDGAGYLGHISFTNLGYGEGSYHPKKGVFPLDIKRIAPKSAGHPHRWQITVGEQTVIVDRRAVDQWDFFESLNPLRPLAVCGGQKITLVFISPEKDLLEPDSNRYGSSVRRLDQKMKQDDIPRSFDELVFQSRKIKFAPATQEEAKQLANRFHLPDPYNLEKRLTEQGTSFPEQSILYYLKRDLPDEDIRSRDRTLGREVDVLLADRAIGIEYNGIAYHNKADDEKKRTFIEKQGVRLIEVSESTRNNFEGNDIEYCYPGHPGEALNRCIAHVYDSLGIEYADIDTSRDQTLIFRQFKSSYIEDSIGAWHPEILAWWSKKNLSLSPFGFKRESAYDAWFECPLCLYEWRNSLPRVNAAMERRSRMSACSRLEPIVCPNCGFEIDANVNGDE